MRNFGSNLYVQRLFFPVWGFGLLIICASLMAGHWVTLPHPERGEVMAANVGFPRFPVDHEQVYAFHFLYGDCSCSRRVLKHVLARSPVPNAKERIVLIGEDPESEAHAIALGFEVHTVTPPQLKEIYGVESAPLLMVSDLEGTIRYAGGYTSRKQGLDIQEMEIIQKAIANQDIDGLPLYGCAVSKSLRAIVDPLDLKQL